MLRLPAIHAAIKPQPLVDYRWRGHLGLATFTMLPALTVGSWLTRQQTTPSTTGQMLAVVFSLALGGVAIVCFGLIIAGTTGQLPALVGTVRAQLVPRQ